MIPKNELMLGNIVRYVGLGNMPGADGLCIIDHISMQSSSWKELSLIPEPLSAKALEAMGFEKSMGDSYVLDLFKVWIDDPLNILVIIANTLHLRGPISVHRLQNLYFAITGKQLFYNGFKL